MGRFCLFLLLVFPLWHTWAQMPNLTFEQFTIKEGLPSNDVWRMAKDKDGFLWIGTGRGVCRYDGYRFQTFADLKLGYCTGISIDHQGDLYASVDVKGLCKINQKTLKIDVLLKNDYDDNDPSTDLHEEAFVDHYGQVWVSDNSDAKRYNPVTKKIDYYPLSDKNVYQYNSFFEDHKHNLWIVSELGLFRYDRPTNKMVCILGERAKKPSHRKNIKLSTAFEDAEGNIWMGGFSAGLVKFIPESETFVFFTKGFENQEVICCKESVDEDGHKMMLVGTMDGLSVFYPERNKIHHLPEFYKKGIHIKNIFDDSQNGIVWICSREGLYKYRYQNSGIRTINLPIELVKQPVSIIDMIELPNQNYLLGLSHTGALEWHRPTNQFRLLRYPANAYITRLRYYQNQIFAFTEMGVMVWKPNGNNFVALEYVNRAFKSVNFKDGLIDRRGRFWIANKLEGVKVFDSKTKKELKLWSDTVNQKLYVKNYVEALREGIDERIWIATCSNGLYYFDEQKADFIDIKQLPINKKDNKDLGGLCTNGLQINAKDGSILAASWGGVSKVSKTGEILHIFDYRRDALLDTYCANICEDNRQNLWFTTNEDIHIASLKTRKINYLTAVEGLKGNYPLSFLYNNDQELMIGYKNLFNILTINNFNIKKTNSQVAISTAEVNGKERNDTANDIVLQPNENVIKLNFSTLNFAPASKNFYRYQLIGFNDDWVYVGNQNTVSFSNLAPKTYRLEVQSGNDSDSWNSHSAVMKITVKPYFTETWIFKTLLGLLFLGIVGALMRWRVNTLDEKNKMELQMTALKLKALQSQMNPHFLFNSLNSVQNYLLSNRGMEGVRYLSKFSKLVRKILENSNHQYLRFDEIIETLRMYVEIESFRFNHEFSYEFNIENNEQLLDKMLPPMLLQPYVENSIWHGLMPKEGNKKLKVSAKVEGKYIVCIIEDNGVGRGFSPRREGHTSRGQEMTKGIFESLSRKDSNAQLVMTDIFDAQNQPAGTRIEMKIPIN
jgi:ligand-binding sensor domain-containing protein